MLGGWDMALHTLLLMMGMDIITGWVAAAVFRKSKKTATGALSSAAGFRGLVKKGVCLLFVVVGYTLDRLFGTEFVRLAVIFTFTANELISVIENAGCMGIKLPPVLCHALDVLTRKENKL